MTASTSIENILIIRLSALGDVLFSLPAVEQLRLRYPDARIDWLVEDRAATVLELYPGLRRQITYPRRALVAASRPQRWWTLLRTLRQHLGELRRTRYDLVLDFQGNLKSGLHLWMSRGQRKIGFARDHSKEGNHWFSHEQVTLAAGTVHRVDKALCLATAVDSADRGPQPAVAPRLTLPADAIAFAEESCRALKLSASMRWGVLHPGTSGFGAFKRWAPDRYAQLADHLHSQVDGLVVTWGPGEESLAREVVAACKRDRTVLAPPTRSLADLGALLKQADFMVGSDSAPLHLAAYLGTPVVALFGPKDPAIYGPRFARREIVRTYLHCSPCTRRRCPDVLCMREITVQQVFQAVLRILDEDRA